MASTSIYVFHWNSTLPIIVSTVVPRGVLDSEALRDVTVDAVLASRRPLHFTDSQLLSGKLFVADDPDGVPARPTGRPLKPTASVVITDRSCILLDLGESAWRGLAKCMHAVHALAPCSLASARTFVSTTSLVAGVPGVVAAAGGAGAGAVVAAPAGA
jgi:hypothetical protein